MSFGRLECIRESSGNHTAVNGKSYAEDCRQDAEGSRSDRADEQRPGATKEESDMAKPIEPTPILKGNDAKRLLKSVKNPVRSAKKAAFVSACDATYRKFAQK